MSFYGTLSAQFAMSINSGIAPIDVTFVDREYATERETVGTTAVACCNAGLSSVMTAGKRHTGWSNQKWKFRNHSSILSAQMLGHAVVRNAEPSSARLCLL